MEAIKLKSSPTDGKTMGRLCHGGGRALLSAYQRTQPLQACCCGNTHARQGIEWGIPAEHYSIHLSIVHLPGASATVN